MALPRGLPQVSDTGKLLGALGYDIVDESAERIATTATGAPAAGLFHSTVVNRKPIPDISKDLSVRYGIERIAVQQIAEVQDEFGPNGERVFRALNDDRGLIRFVGSSWVSLVDNLGQRASCINSGDYLEITFYGTGLNLVTIVDNGTRDLRVSVDGGAEGSNVYTLSSGVLSGRNYSTNQILNLASNLTLGVHTIRVRTNTTFTYAIHIYGFEILNEQLLTTTANTNSNTSLTNVASTAALKVGMDITGTGIPANTTITAISGSTITMSAAATATATGVTVRFGTNFIKVNPGTSYINGVAETLASQSTFAYNSGFESITRDGLPVVSLGSKGGRVVVYQKQDGSIAKSVTAVNTSQVNLPSANHTYEEVVRRHNFREFGAGRSDDFSLVSAPSGGNAQGGSYAFTLEDGTTTLTASGAGASGLLFMSESLAMNNVAGASVTLTFVGTGLDLALFNWTSSTQFASISVDGTSIGASPVVSGTGTTLVMKIVSGLPYGTHTVRFASNAVTNAPGIRQFIVYGPKKPTLPAGAVELADYNVMADYGLNTALGGADLHGTGTLSKTCSREFVYTGTWSIAPSNSGYFDAVTTATVNGSTASLTFFGTGIILSATYGTSGSAVVSIDGSLYTGAATTPASGLVSGTWTPGTSTWVLTGGQGSVLAITGLPLGVHKVSINITQVGSFIVRGWEIVTPIHSPKSNLLGDLQNTLPVGSCAISDNRVTTTSVNTNSIKPKAWAQAVGVASGPTTTSSIAIPMPDMSTTVKTSGGRVLISYSTSVSNSSANNTTRTAIYVNGILLNSEKTATSASNGSDETNSDTQIIFLPAGTHKIDVYWWCGGGTSMASGTRRNLIVAEL